MADNSYSWNFLDGSAVNPQTALPGEVGVKRFALSHILVPFRNYPNRSIALINLHPDSWDSFMLPYGGLRLEEPEAATDAKTFADLSEVLHVLIADNLDGYLEGAERELSAYYSELPELRETPPLYRNYSLKFSKSAGQWTAYVFTYHAAPLSSLVPSDLPRAEVPMESASISQALSEEAIAGTKLEENVVALLRSGLIKFWASTAA